MTFASPSRRVALLAALASSLWLAACGGGGGSGNGSTNVRAVNLASDLPGVDIFTGDTKQFSALTTDTLAPSLSIEANTYTLNVKAAGDGATLLTGSYALSKDLHYTAIVWGRQTALRLTTLPEDEDVNNIGTGNTRVRMFNATIDSGTLDVYFTSATADLAETPPTQALLNAGTLAGFREISAGTYRLRVTGAGDPSDVRLDIPSVVLPAKQYATLVLTATGTGGVLLNGALLAQQGAQTTMKNTKARVRLAASVASAGVVSATIGGNAVFTNYRSPRVSTSYALVDSGNVATSVTVNGAVVSNTARNFAAGSDYTLLTYGTPAAAKVVVFTDDNRVPSTTTRAKLRLVNGIAGSDPLTLALDFQNFVATNDVVPGTASAYAAPNIAGSARIEVTSQLVALPLFTVTTSNSGQTLLLGQGVYTVFMLDGLATPTGRFIKDR